ncbi:MAG: hypothetical protein V1734_05110 [Nanoarchaeota archaeon]
MRKRKSDAELRIGRAMGWAEKVQQEREPMERNDYTRDSSRNKALSIFRLIYFHVQ